MGKKELQGDMIRITKGQGVSQIMIGQNEADSLIIIPGVSSSNGIFTIGTSLVFSNDKFDETSTVIFNSPADLERTLSRISAELRPQQAKTPIFMQEPKNNGNE